MATELTKTLQFGSKSTLKWQLSSISTLKWQ